MPKNPFNLSFSEIENLSWWDLNKWLDSAMEHIDNADDNEARAKVALALFILRGNHV